MTIHNTPLVTELHCLVRHVLPSSGTASFHQRELDQPQTSSLTAHHLLATAIWLVITFTSVKRTTEGFASIPRTLLRHRASKNITFPGLLNYPLATVASILLAVSTVFPLRLSYRHVYQRHTASTEYLFPPPSPDSSHFTIIGQ